MCHVVALHVRMFVCMLRSHVHHCAFPCLLINHDRGWGPLMCFVLAFHLISKLHTWLLGHHALKCVIDGPRVEGHAPLSPLHDRECGHAHICLKIPCHTLLALCCCQLQVSAGRFGRSAVLSADRQRMFGREHNI